MFNTLTILSTMENVSIVCDSNYILYGMVDGKLYDVFSGKPVNHGGRQLRENSRYLLSAMRDDAFSRMEEMKNEQRKVIDEEVEKALAENALEAPQKAPQAPQGLGMLESMLADTMAKYATEKAIGDILPVIREKVISEFGILPVKHEIKIPDRKTWETTEVLHKDFDEMLAILSLPRKHGIYMYGPAGTGKSHIAKQLAKALNVPYHSATCVSDDVTLKGYKDAMGNYHETEFYKAFVNGGLFLLDELDASIPDVLNTINNALSEGEFSFPCGMMQMHKDFYVMGAGNTVCNGATVEYTGRFALDKATMDRFAFFEVTYDRQIEISLAQGDELLVDFAHAFRDVVSNAGIHCLFTYRGISRLADFSGIMSKEKAIKCGILQGMDVSDIMVIATSLSGDNEWIKAFKNLTEGR